MELPASYCDSATTPSVFPGIYFVSILVPTTSIISILFHLSGFCSFFNNPFALNRAYARICASLLYCKSVSTFTWQRRMPSEWREPERSGPQGSLRSTLKGGRRWPSAHWTGTAPAWPGFRCWSRPGAWRRPIHRYRPLPGRGY